MKKKQGMWLGVVLIILIAGAILFGMQDRKANAEYEVMAECIADSGATFYGAFWCPHCIEQKRLFGSANKTLPYVECSTQNRQGQLEVCREAGIESYPTWEFADGERVSGLVPLEELAEKTGCALPQEA